MGHEQIEKWERRADQVLMEEGEVLEALKRAVEENYLSEDEAEERMRAYHHGVCPDVEGRDL